MGGARRARSGLGRSARDDAPDADHSGETMLSTDFSAETDKVGRAVRYLLWYTGRRTTAVFSLPDSWPTPRNQRFRKELDVLEELVYGLINDRRSSGHHGEDLLGMLIDARDEDTGEAMSDRQLRDEVMTILIAGHETTANALAWTWFLLARHPEAAGRLRAELDETLGGGAPQHSQIFRPSPTLRWSSRKLLGCTRPSG
jgi:cytochrome P450